MTTGLRVKITHYALSLRQSPIKFGVLGKYVFHGLLECLIWSGEQFLKTCPQQVLWGNVVLAGLFLQLKPSFF